MPDVPQAVKSSSPARVLSELEGAVLCLLQREGPLTAYSVRQEFAASPTDHFSGSAGAIYPLMRRLERDDLIARSGTAGPKGGVAFGMTAAGLAALERWLMPDDPSPMARVTFDPLRTRVLVLGLLSPAARRAFIDRADRELTAQIRQQRETLEIWTDDKWIIAAQRGALESMLARRRWVRSLRDL